jgi:hypothetical protein
MKYVDFNIIKQQKYAKIRMLTRTWFEPEPTMVQKRTGFDQSSWECN